MPNIENINIDFTFNPLLIVLGIIVFAGYTFFIYKYTVPQISPLLKYFLFALRTISLALILIVIFEPIISLKYEEEETPKSYVFIDESRSIVFKDSSQSADNVKNIVAELLNKTNNESRFFSFAIDVDSLAPGKIKELKFKGALTNLNSVIEFLESKKDNIQSAIIISDGIITEGISPIYSAEKLSFPLFTIGIGDTTDKNDVAITKVIKNDYIYAQKPTTIIANILNKGYAGKNVTIQLYENNKAIGQKNIELSINGLNKIEFDYLPQIPGENKLSIVVSRNEGEISFENNSNTFFVNVLNNKVRILLVAGSPSEDLTFIKNSLISDVNLDVKSITQISQNKFLEGEIYNAKIDSADVLFLIGFPAENTPVILLNKIAEKIRNKNIPFLLTFAASLDLNKLKSIESELPFTITQVSNEISLVQPDIIDVNNSLLNNNSVNPIVEWNNLPPVAVFNSGIIPKPESEIISLAKISNIPVNLPLILTRSVGRKRSLSINAANIWKWKLQRNQINLFDNFITNSVKWLNTNYNQKYVEIKTSKKIYSQGEQIDFTAQVYDETFNPYDAAEVKAKISDGNKVDELIFTSAGLGIYEGVYQINQTGDYHYSGEAFAGSKMLGIDNGIFSISETDIEKINTKMDKNLLTLLANSTGGKYYNSSDFEQIFKEINAKKYNKVLKKSYIQEMNLWSDEILLILIILIFSLEWFFRKRAGML